MMYVLKRYFMLRNTKNKKRKHENIKMLIMIYIDQYPP
jgi:hypothetical protein